MHDDAASERLVLHSIATLDLAAASGIALREGLLYVLADDELDLAVYTLDGVRTNSIPLLDGTLPVEPVARKAAKPDFEALLEWVDGSLLAFGSGSTPSRRRAAWVRFDPARPRVESVDLSPLYAVLARELPQLNIEGAVVLNDRLYLCSRGNGSRLENALIQLDLERVREDLATHRVLSADAFVGLTRVALPDLDGTPLSLTDLAAIDNRLIFSAAAEASANTYDDGVCAGSAIGMLAPDGRIDGMKIVSPRLKLEGVCVTRDEFSHRLWLVADADDHAARAPLLQTDWPPRSAFRQHRDEG